MRIESIEIRNYRQYKNLTLRFPKRTEFDLHVIIGPNGVGKTNLLNAINWCLYNDEPHLTDKEEKLPIANLQAIEEAKASNQTRITVSVSIKMSADNKIIEVTRETPFLVASRFQEKGTLDVSITGPDGNTTYLSDEEKHYKIDEYTPQRIREFFFFDGERLINYFGNNGENVKDSIYEIAQINIVTNAQRHMEEYIGNLSREISKNNPDVNKYKDEMEKKQKEIDEITQSISELEDTIERAKERIAVLDKYIQGKEHINEDLNRMRQNDARLEELKEDRKRAIAAIIEMIKKYYVLLAFYEMNKRTSELIQEKSDKGKLPPQVEIDLIRKSINEHVCQICGQSFDKDSNVREHLNQMLNSIEFSTIVSNQLAAMKSDIRKAVEDAKHYKKDRIEAYSNLERIENQISILEKDNSEISSRLGTGNLNEKTLQLNIEERNELKGNNENNNRKIGAHKERLALVTREYAEARDRFQNAVEATKTKENLHKKYQMAYNAMNVLEQIEKEIIAELKDEMEKNTKEYFTNLVWKQNTFGRIEFDEKYKIHVHHKETDEPCLGSASAAERELLALAFTLALHKVSGHDAPIFIDTPVGRVSDKNRFHFGETLVPVSKEKQLILAFTPDEFSDDIKKTFKPTVMSSCVTLVNDEEVTNAEEVFQR